MTINEFFNAYLGIWIESNKSSDESTNDQCVDLWRTYNRKVIGAPDKYGNAVDFWTNYPTDFYDKIPNTPTGIPQLGDVMIWGTRYGKYGHIAVCTDIADVKTFTSFDQNDPIGEPCHYQPHNYTGLLGWLRPKNQAVLIGDTEENVLMGILSGGFITLPEGDICEKGNLEGYLRKMIDEHKVFAEYENKADQLDGFIAKWVKDYFLEVGSGLTQIEREMDKLFDMEEAIGKLRDASEKAVSKQYMDDESLIKALEAVGTEITNLNKQIKSYQDKLSTKKILYTFILWKYLIKVCDNV